MIKMLIYKKLLCINTVKPSALHRAVRDQDFPAIDRLLEDPSIDINKNVYYWDTALHLAVRNNNIPLISKLLDHGANIDQLSFEEGYSPLHIAVMDKNLETAELLLTRGADVNILSRNLFIKYWTPLHFAISQHDNSLIELLFRFNADLNGLYFKGMDVKYEDPYSNTYTIIDSYYRTPLHVAVEQRRLDTVSFLLHLDKVDINAVDSLFASKYASLFYDAVKSESKEISRLLLDAGIDVNAMNQENSSIFECVSQLESNNQQPSKTRPCVELLEKHLVKLDIIGCRLIEQNIDAVNDYALDSFRNECLQEIELLNKIFIDKTNLYCSGVLLKSERFLATYVRNVDENAVIYEDLISRFPVYGGIIYFKLKRALKRCQLLKKAEKIIFDIFKPLPNTFVREIFFYLSEEDLKIISA